jgi:Rrf2 family transcriptional regulator, cysteine metabolism repressor
MKNDLLNNLFPSSISKKSHYALRALFELARRGPERPVKAHELASAHAIPLRFLEVILNELKQVGLVKSFRGKDGGFILADDPRDISIKQIISLISDKDGCPGPMDPAFGVPGDYAFHRLWSDVSEAVDRIYSTITLSRLVEWESEYRSRDIQNYTI